MGETIRMSLAFNLQTCSSTQSKVKQNRKQTGNNSKAQSQRAPKHNLLFTVPYSFFTFRLNKPSAKRLILTLEHLSSSSSGFPSLPELSTPLSIAARHASTGSQSCLSECLCYKYSAIKIFHSSFAPLVSPHCQVYTQLTSLPVSVMLQCNQISSLSVSAKC